ncbi:hypothetical protein [Halalkalibacter flavus]|uniref:hypothetical protein n=1 Tax=Halalkalibacter flavus TaxID=3090668 RepID=UPI002FC5979F
MQLVNYLIKDEGENMLTVSTGYLILLFFGVFFTSLTIIMQRHRKTEMTAEQFSTAGRSVGVALASASIIAAWTWAASMVEYSKKKRI